MARSSPELGGTDRRIAEMKELTAGEVGSAWMTNSLKRGCLRDTGPAPFGQREGQALAFDLITLMTKTGPPSPAETEPRTVGTKALSG